jgi:hypothetical protein
MGIFIPKKINVGFVNRDGTYDGKLAYIIYFDEKGKLRKEASWESWRNKKIPNVICDNEPTDGFVLNKKAGGYSTGWNHRNTYVRVYDPRGFEFEITVPNLLYILQNTNSIKGKGLEGKFIYGWDGKDLLLMPIDSPDYQEIAKMNAIIHENKTIKSKDLKIGASYLTKDKQTYVYLGKFDKWDNLNKGKHFYFYSVWSNGGCFEIFKSISGKLIDVVDENPYFDYANIMDKLEYKSEYSPIDDTKDVFHEFTFKKFKKNLEDYSRWFLTNIDGKYKRIYVDRYYISGVGYVDGKYQVEDPDKKVGYYSRNEVIFTGTAEEIYNKYKPSYKDKYLANGKLYKKEMTY